MASGFGAGNGGGAFDASIGTAGELVGVLPLLLVVVSGIVKGGSGGKGVAVAVGAMDGSTLTTELTL